MAVSVRLPSSPFLSVRLAEGPRVGVRLQLFHSPSAFGSRTRPRPSVLSPRLRDDRAARSANAATLSAGEGSRPGGAPAALPASRGPAPCLLSGWDNDRRRPSRTDPWHCPMA